MLNPPRTGQIRSSLRFRGSRHKIRGLDFFGLNRSRWPPKELWTIMNPPQNKEIKKTPPETKYKTKLDGFYFIFPFFPPFLKWITIKINTRIISLGLGMKFHKLQSRAGEFLSFTSKRMWNVSNWVLFSGWNTAMGLWGAISSIHTNVWAHGLFTMFWGDVGSCPSFPLNWNLRYCSAGYIPSSRKLKKSAFWSSQETISSLMSQLRDNIKPYEPAKRYPAKKLIAGCCYPTRENLAHWISCDNHVAQHLFITLHGPH